MTGETQNMPVCRHKFLAICGGSTIQPKVNSMPEDLWPIRSKSETACNQDRPQKNIDSHSRGHDWIRQIKGETTHAHHQKGHHREEKASKMVMSMVLTPMILEAKRLWFLSIRAFARATKPKDWHPKEKSTLSFLLVALSPPAVECLANSMAAATENKNS